MAVKGVSTRVVNERIAGRRMATLLVYRNRAAHQTRVRSALIGRPVGLLLRGGSSQHQLVGSLGRFTHVAWHRVAWKPRSQLFDEVPASRLADFEMGRSGHAIQLV